jgi:hypothetical protein
MLGRALAIMDIIIGAGIDKCERLEIYKLVSNSLIDEENRHHQSLVR